MQNVRPDSQVLQEMQHSKWATSNHLFDYNAFINDFYNLLEEYKDYKHRNNESADTSPEKLPEILSRYGFKKKMPITIFGQKIKCHVFSQKSSTFNFILHT